MNKLSNSWVAGFFEGEGCISKRKDRGYTVLIAQAFQINRTVKELMKSLKELFKGKFYIRKSTKINNKPQIQWIINKRQDVLYFLKCIYPYCQIRKQDIKIAINYLKNHPQNYDIDKINYYRTKGYTWLKISKLLKISERTIYRVMERNLVKTKL